MPALIYVFAIKAHRVGRQASSSSLRHLQVLWSQNRRYQMKMFVRSVWDNQEGQDIAEYAVMLAVILVIVVGTIRLIGSNANNVFSSVGSAIK